MENKPKQTKTFKEKYRESKKLQKYYQKRQRKYHKKNREKENQYFREHYAENKEYFRRKNKEYNEKNGEKWAARRAEIRKEWIMNKCSPALVARTFEDLGASITVEKEITAFQLFALIEVLGYKISDVTYPPFVNKWKYFADRYLASKNPH